MDRTAKWDAGYRALIGSVAVVQPPSWERVEVTGADRLRFINGLVTCDVRELAAGESRYGFVTGPKGRVLADVVVAAYDDRLRLEVPESRGEAIAEHLSRYVVADRVTVERSDPRSRLVVAGPRAGAALVEVLGRARLPSGWSSLAHGDLWLRGEMRFGVAGWCLEGRDRVLAEVAGKLEAAGAEQGAAEAVEAVRVEHGLPWFGPDFGPEHFPQETGLEAEAVSYSKGCYLGQEIVARIHYRGQVNRRLVGLLARKGTELETGSTLEVAGEAVGAVTTACFSPRLGRPAALAMVHRKAVEAGTVDLPDGTRLEVARLPLVERPPSSWQSSAEAESR